ncbi:hypothetical protein JCM10207_004406, partial [Rhodosporidiobolus poonsookiae]
DDSYLVLKHEQKQILVHLPDSYSEALEIAQQHFPSPSPLHLYLEGALFHETEITGAEWSTLTKSSVAGTVPVLRVKVADTDEPSLLSPSSDSSVCGSDKTINLFSEDEKQSQQQPQQGATQQRVQRQSNFRLAQLAALVLLFLPCFYLSSRGHVSVSEKLNSTASETSCNGNNTNNTSLEPVAPGVSNSSTVWWRLEKFGHSTVFRPSVLGDRRSCVMTLEDLRLYLKENSFGLPPRQHRLLWKHFPVKDYRIYATWTFRFLEPSELHEISPYVLTPSKLPVKRAVLAVDDAEHRSKSKSCRIDWPKQAGFAVNESEARKWWEISVVWDGGVLTYLSLEQ